jgi:hypothetical protein
VRGDETSAMSAEGPLPAASEESQPTVKIQVPVRPEAMEAGHRPERILRAKEGHGSLDTQAPLTEKLRGTCRSHDSPATAPTHSDLIEQLMRMAVQHHVTATRAGGRRAISA